MANIKQLGDLIPVRLTNSEDEDKWLDDAFKLAATNDGKAIVAAISILIHEVINLQGVVADMRDSH